MTKPTLEDLNITWKRVNNPDKIAALKAEMLEFGCTEDLEQSDIYVLDDQSAVDLLAEHSKIVLEAITGFRASEAALDYIKEGLLLAINGMLVQQLGFGNFHDTSYGDEETQCYAPKYVLEEAGYVDNGDDTMRPPVLAPAP